VWFPAVCVPWVAVAAALFIVGLFADAIAAVSDRFERADRGVGGWYVVEVALARGWELRPADVREEVRLWWSAASKVA
jgi:hypothetical protein